LVVALFVASCGGHKEATPGVLPPQSSLQKSSSAVPTFAQTLSERHLTDAGETSPEQQVHLLISLAHRNQADLDKLIHDQATPGSPSYLRFLTPAEFDRQFGALSPARDAIKQGLQQAGFQVDADRFGASVIEADAPAAKVEALFKIQLHDVHEKTGRIAHMPTSTPTTPDFLQQDVVSIVGLDTTTIAWPIPPSSSIAQVICGPDGCPTPTPRPTPTGSVSPPPQPTPTPDPGSPFPPCPGQAISPPAGYTDDTTFGPFGYAPYTYAYDYDIPVQHGCSGSAQYPIGILGEADVSDSDLAAFYSNMNVQRTGSLSRVGTGGTSSIPAAFEATLDVETVSALAPASNVYLYLTPSLSADNFTSAMNTVVQQNLVAVLSISFAFCEKQPWPSLYEAASGVDNAAAQASAQGITVAAASGDSGGPSYLSGCPSVMAPAASSYVVGVGGTSPVADNNNQGAPGANAYRPGFQYAWGQPAPSADDPPCATNFCGTGGGASTHFQTAEQLSACGGSGTTWKCVPDVSFAADIYHRGAMVFNGQLVAGGGANGTSFATPIFAAIQAEIDQRQNTRKGNIVGRLYSLWRQYGYGPYAAGHQPIFQDITSGNSGYAANSGYDAASGIGSLDGFELSSVE
jgi:subtilase family serine protease